ncbi:MAG: hypothetical protein BRD57_06570, partial [Proteobacteria bacterium SW_6_67_9]
MMPCRHAPRPRALAPSGIGPILLHSNEQRSGTRHITTVHYQRLIRIAISLALTLPFLLHASGTVRLNVLDQLEDYAYDARLNLTLPGTQDNRIAIVEVDEASLKAVGRWPWPRDKLAQLVDQLYEHYDVDALGFDIVFAEKDRNRALERLHELAEGRLADNPDFRRTVDALTQELDRDRSFARSLEGRNVALGYFFRSSVDQDDPTTGALPDSVGRIDDTGADALPLPRPEGYGANLEVLQESAAGGGFFDNPLVGSDGVFRRVPLIQQYDGGLYELLALATLRASMGWPSVDLEIVRAGRDYQAVEAAHVGPYRIPLDAQGAVLVPSRGPQGSFPYISAKDVLNGSAERKRLEDKIVLVGA